jgi:hypothetical protein
MTKHDEVRQILHDTGFKFTDHSDRTALDMTDEEVDAFVIAFVSQMAELGRAMTASFQQLLISVNTAMEPMHDLGRVLAAVEAERRRI